MGDFSLRGDQSKVESFGQDTATTGGLVVTAGGTAHTKGAWFELIASTTFDYSSINMNIRSSTTTRTGIYDIAVGSAGNEKPIVEDMYIVIYGNNRQGVFIELPVHIPAGSRVSIRSQSNVASPLSVVCGHGISSSFSSPESLAKVVSYGVDLAASKGTVIEPGSSIHIKGVYSELEASTAESLRGIYISVGDNINPASGNRSWLIDLAIGAAASERVLVENMFVHSSPDENMIPSIQFFPISIPSGSRIAVRAQCQTNDVSDRLIDVAVMGAV